MDQQATTVLVTGGSGFVGSYCILHLLREGYQVKTTLRSLAKKPEVIRQLQAAGVEELGRLTFVEADLRQDAGWDEAVHGCTYVLHVASPFPAGVPAHEDDLIIPARDGARRVLRAARDAGVKRVVLTSSFAAIGYSINPVGHVFTEADWTDPTGPLPAYIKSKTLAERAAWEFIDQQGNGLELSVINPTGIFGPVLGPDFSSSIGMVQLLLAGKLTDLPQVSFGVVDVRDVADLHLRAMTQPAAAGQRFLATADGSLSFSEMAQLLGHLAAHVEPELEPLVPQPGVVKEMSNAKARTLLGWHPRDKETAILATATSLLAFNLV